MADNVVFLKGQIGNTPEIRYTKSGTSVCNLRLATVHRYPVGDEWKEETSWHSLVFYGNLADLANFLKKGNTISMEGRITYREFTPTDGKARVITEIVVNSFHRVDRELWKEFANARKQGGAGGGGAGEEQAPPDDHYHGDGDDVNSYKGLT